MTTNETETGTEATPTAASRPKGPMALVATATVLSIASLVWTAYSLYDLLKPASQTGFEWNAGLAVALGADVVWGAVLIAEWNQYKLGWSTKKGKQVNLTHAVGWIFLAAVVTLLVWHGLKVHSPAAAFGGSLIPIGAKVIWLFAIAAHRDPAALTPEQQAKLFTMERERIFKERQSEQTRAEKRRKHEDTLEDVRMNGEVQRAEQKSKFSVMTQRINMIEDLRDSLPAQAQLTGQGDALIAAIMGVQQPSQNVIQGSAEKPKALPKADAPQADTYEDEGMDDLDDEDAFPETAVNVRTFAAETATKPTRISVTIPIDPEERYQRNRLIAAEYWLRKQMNGGAELARGAYAKEKGISAPQLSKLLGPTGNSEKGRFPESSFTVEDLDELHEDIIAS